jgi:hypothetical protein
MAQFSMFYLILVLLLQSIVEMVQQRLMELLLVILKYQNNYLEPCDQ